MKVNKKRLIKDKIKRRRQIRVRSRIFGLENKPRVSVFRSIKHISAQIINDAKGKTLVAASDLELKSKKANKTEKALAVGKLLAQKAVDQKIKKVIFDRGANKYHGRLKALADGLREGGLEF